MVFLCKYCGTITNHPLPGLCEQSPTEEHKWLSGDEVEGHIRMIWDREPAGLTKLSG